MIRLSGVSIGVSDIFGSMAFLEKTLGFKGHDPVKIESDALKQTWRMDEALNGRYAVVRRSRGLHLRLQQFNQPGRKIWGLYKHPRDRGLLSLNIAVRNLESRWGGLVAAGVFPLFTEITDMPDDVPIPCTDSNGVMFDLACGARIGRDSISLNVSNHNAVEFYQGLGFSVGETGLVEQPDELPRLLGSLPVRQTWLQTGAESNVLYLNSYPNVRSRSLRGVAIPPNHGLLSVVMDVDDLEQTCDLLEDLCRQRGGKRVSGPKAVDFQPEGIKRVASFLGPDGELLEFHQNHSS